MPEGGVRIWKNYVVITPFWLLRDIEAERPLVPSTKFSTLTNKYYSLAKQKFNDIDIDSYSGAADSFALITYITL